jgi:hypothetical protein
VSHASGRQANRRPIRRLLSFPRSTVVTIAVHTRSHSTCLSRSPRSSIRFASLIASCSTAGPYSAIKSAAICHNPRSRLRVTGRERGAPLQGSLVPVIIDRAYQHRPHGTATGRDKEPSHKKGLLTRHHWASHGQGQLNPWLTHPRPQPQHDRHCSHPPAPQQNWAGSTPDDMAQQCFWRAEA